MPQSRLLAALVAVLTLGVANAAVADIDSRSPRSTTRPRRRPARTCSRMRRPQLGSDPSALSWFANTSARAAPGAPGHLIGAATFPSASAGQMAMMTRFFRFRAICRTATSSVRGR